MAMSIVPSSPGGVAVIVRSRVGTLAWSPWMRWPRRSSIPIPASTMPF